MPLIARNSFRHRLPFILGAALAPFVLAACGAGSPESNESVGAVQQALSTDTPSRIQAESYTAFLDSDNIHNGNCGSAAIDEETTSDPNGGGCDVGWTAPGEWIEYYLTSPTTRNVNLIARTASAYTNRSLHFMIDGQNVGSSLTAPSAGWQAFADRTAENITLGQGGHTLRVVFDSGDTNLNYIDITPARTAVPARIQAEDYQHVWETTPATNSGGACDRGDGVDKETTSDPNGGGCDVGWTAAGEWLDYDVSLSQGQNLDFTVRAASAYAGKSLHLTLDGQPIGGSLTAPSAGWQSFADLNVTGVPVTAGNHTVRINLDTGDTNVNYLDIHASAGQLHQRRGLVVIADFANQKLEDYTGGGFKSVADIQAQLTKMKDHWSWLTRNTEQFNWDITRVTLPVNFSSNAYANEVDFRTAVISQAKTQVNPAIYDLDNNGVLDSVWIIGSSGSNNNLGFLTGGTEAEAGAGNFVDGQGSNSAVEQNTGAFNHEVGHCQFGLPDLYGDYGSLKTLSLMDSPYDQPGNDYSAFDRLKAGWTVPTVITQNTTGITLNSTTTSFDSVKVPGPLANEYFLIEYRKRPASGYGASGPVAYNGLAIYHVLEGSDRNSNPPTLKFESASRALTPNQQWDLQDFAYPGNTAMSNPLVLRTYYGGGEVFRITNLAWAGAAIRFDITVSNPSPTSLGANGSFEQGSGLPSSWSTAAFDSSATFAWSTSTAASGTHSASIATTSTPNDARWYEPVSGLTVGQTYAACGKLKGQNIATNSQAVVGASVFAGDWNHTTSLSGTFDWTPSCMLFSADNTSMQVGCRLGFFGSTVTGSLWCDDVGVYSLVKPF